MNEMHRRGFLGTLTAIGAAFGIGKTVAVPTEQKSTKAFPAAKAWRSKWVKEIT